MAAGCLEVLGECLNSAENTPGSVIAEMCAALAVLASEGNENT